MRIGRVSRTAVTTLLVLLGGLASVSCGDEDGDTRAAGSPRAADVRGLAKRAFGPNPAARSGRIDGEIEIALRGVAGFAEPFSFTVSGPFRLRRGSELPDYEAELGARDNGVGLTALRGRSYISLGSTGYPLPSRVRGRLTSGAARGRNGLTRMLEQFGIAPWRWEIDKRVAGTELVGGVRSVRVETGVDVDRVLRDADTLAGLLSSLGVARATGLPPRISARARQILVRSVAAAQGATWIGLSDHVMRRAGMAIRFAIARADRAFLGGMTAATVKASLRVTEIGRPQRIAAPASLGSYADFELGLGALGDARRP